MLFQRSLAIGQPKIIKKRRGLEIVARAGGSDRGFESAADRGFDRVGEADQSALKVSDRMIHELSDGRLARQQCLFGLGTVKLLAPVFHDAVEQLRGERAHRGGI